MDLIGSDFFQENCKLNCKCHLREDCTLHYSESKVSHKVMSPMKPCPRCLSHREPICPHLPLWISPSCRFCTWGQTKDHFVCLLVVVCLNVFFKISFIIFGCAGSALLCEGFLYLWRVGASLVGEHGLWGMGASVVAVWTQQLWCMDSAAARLVESSRARNWTHVPCIGRWLLILNHQESPWTYVIHSILLCDLKFSSVYNWGVELRLSIRVVSVFLKMCV